MDEYIHITRWHDFQHDKRRKGAPWHKEHAAQIDNDSYLHLSLGARGVLIGVRLMYGRRHPEGVSVASARRLLATTANDAKHFGAHLEALNRAGFITISASNVLAPREQDASNPLALEEETETEEEKEQTQDQEPNPTQPEARPPQPATEPATPGGSGKVKNGVKDLAHIGTEVKAIIATTGASFYE